MSALTLLRLLTGMASPYGLAAALQAPPSLGLEGAVEGAGDTGTAMPPAMGCAPAPSSDGRASSAVRTRKTISVGLTRSMSTVPPSVGRSVASPVAAS